LRDNNIYIIVKHKFKQKDSKLSLILTLNQAIGILEAQRALFFTITFFCFVLSSLTKFDEFCFLLNFCIFFILKFASYFKICLKNNKETPNN